MRTNGSFLVRTPIISWEKLQPGLDIVERAPAGIDETLAVQ